MGDGGEGSKVNISFKKTTASPLITQGWKVSEIGTILGPQYNSS